MHNKYKILLSLFLSLLILLAFTPPLNPTVGGWYQQFMPNLNGRHITDIFFLDSLTGWAVTNSNGQYDTAFILKTANGGDNWFINYSRTAWFTGFNRIKFLDQNTGFVCGVSVYSGPKGLTKTTNGGINWFDLNIPDPFLNYLDMSVINDNTIWLVSSEPLTGGVYYTSNGGLNWDRQFSGGNQNPNKIYMYNARIGFMSNSSASPNIYKTTNSGENWDIVVSGEYFTDMHFTDSLKGWKCMPRGIYDIDSSVRKTTNGGINWAKQILPHGGMILTSQIYKFAFINQDTIWGTGSQLNYGNGRYRGILFRTTNGGNNWLFQIPDTSFGIQGYGLIQFLNKNTGWVNSNTTGIHTTNGGNDTFYTGIQQISSEVPKQFKLYQNYPNPFNPRTVIKYQIVNSKEQIENVKLIVYNIQGREVITLVNENQSYGTYEVDFSGNGLSSGVYFYQIIITNLKGGVVYRETKKMILIK